MTKSKTNYCIILFLIFNINTYSQCFINGKISVGEKLNTTGSPKLDKILTDESKILKDLFLIEVDLCAYDDLNKPNAYASQLCDNLNCDGTVRIGKTLLLDEIVNSNGYISVIGIMAHEYAHIFQLKNETNLKGKYLELQADFFAGWYLGRTKNISFQDLKPFATSLYQKGDFEFWSIQHHGTPEERAKFLITGFVYSDLSLKEAYYKSIEYINSPNLNIPFQRVEQSNVNTSKNTDTNKINSSIVVLSYQEKDPILKAIDSEKYEDAKKMLKSIVKENPLNGKANFLIGKIYLKQEQVDSAKVYFQKGLSGSDGARFNYIGLGQIDLEKGDISSALAKFELVMKEIKKKEVEEYVYIAQAYMNADTPDYQAALAILEKAKLANPNDPFVKLVMGDAYYGLKNQNDAYSAYRDAYNTDKNLIRAKMQLGVLLKGAKAYVEAVKAYDEVVSIDSNYGPVYRELAETYYLWANNKPGTYKENIAKALTNYEKYMSLTDYSLSSRMRHADFLILAKEYKELEKEALEMKKMDKVNPRILRYLGYAAYENGNTDEAINALTEFLGKANKIIGGDYYFLGLAQVKKSIGADGKTIDATLLAQGVAHLKKAVEMDMNVANGLNEIGKAYFGQKLYGVAAGVFEAAILNTTSKNFFEDNIYYGLCVHTVNRGKDAKTIDVPALTNADKAMDNVIAAKPDYPEAYLYKARINSVMAKDDIMTESYQKYVDALTAKGPEEITKNKAKVTEAYNNMASFYANSDKAKAKELLNKTLALDPTNAYATESLKVLK